jgi:hypothetical protein
MINVGDLIMIKENRKFPIAMRRGPGYMFNIVEQLKPGWIGIIIAVSATHQPTRNNQPKWFSLLTPRGNTGWIPEAAMSHLRRE